MKLLVLLILALTTVSCSKLRLISKRPAEKVDYNRYPDFLEAFLPELQNKKSPKPVIAVKTRRKKIKK